MKYFHVSVDTSVYGARCSTCIVSLCHASTYLIQCCAVGVLISIIEMLHDAKCDIENMSQSWLEMSTPASLHLMDNHMNSTLKAHLCS